MKLEIIVGRKFEADFTAMQSDGLTGEVLDSNTDSGTFTLSTNGLNPEKIDGTPINMTISDAQNGVFSLSIPSSVTSTLSQDIGFKEDKYPTTANYIGTIDLVIGGATRTATVDIFVREIGL